MATPKTKFEEHLPATPEPLTAHEHVVIALSHIRQAAQLTTDPGLQGDLERARQVFQRRLDRSGSL